VSPIEKDLNPLNGKKGIIPVRNAVKIFGA